MTEPNGSIDVAVVFVTWNARKFIIEAIQTLLTDLATSGLTWRILVVDNASSDGTATTVREHFPAVEVIESGGNFGFAAGNNIAMRVLGFHDTPKTVAGVNSPKTVFLLNPDTLTQPDAIKTLYVALQTLPNAGVVGAGLSYEDGSFQHGAFGFPGLWQIFIDLFPIPNRLYGRLYNSALNGRYSAALYARGDPFPVDHTLGATMLLKREVIEETGLFDEQFFMYCEEVDWSMRIRKAGWEIYTVPRAKITHLEAKSTSQIKPTSLLNLWTSRFKLYRKHYSPMKVTIARFLVRVGFRFQIRKARHSTAISNDQRDALIATYRKIMEL